MTSVRDLTRHTSARCKGTRCRYRTLRSKQMDPSRNEDLSRYPMQSWIVPSISGEGLLTIGLQIANDELVRQVRARLRTQASRQ